MPTRCRRFGSMRSKSGDPSSPKLCRGRFSGLADMFTKTDSWFVRGSGKRPWSRQIARLGPPLRLLKCIGIRIAWIRKVADLARPVRREEGRLRWDFPTKLLVRLFHKLRIERIFVILGGQRLRDSVAIFQPFGDARVFLAPQLRERIAVSRLVEIVVKVSLLKKQGFPEGLQRRLRGEKVGRFVRI